MQLDATVADQYIKYPNDLELLNDSREWSEELIDNSEGWYHFVLFGGTIKERY